MNTDSEMKLSTFLRNNVPDHHRANVEYRELTDDLDRMKEAIASYVIPCAVEDGDFDEHKRACVVCKKHGICLAFCGGSR